jgi:alpha-glucosidase (family GH31 glycosyl hydrolase)
MITVHDSDGQKICQQCFSIKISMDLSLIIFNSYHGTAHGVLWMNSNGIYYVHLQSSSYDIQSYWWCIYVFLRFSPSVVVQQYMSIIGKPAMIPYW